MKKIILAITLFFCISGISANEPVKTPSKKLGPIAIYGRPYIKGQSVECMGGTKLCAVIPRVDENPQDRIITVYNEDGSVMEVFSYSSYTIDVNGDTTTISWIP